MAISPNPFDTFPIETTQHIASYLASDFDLNHFRLVSPSTLAAVDADNDSFWRRRFHAVFERPTTWTPAEQRTNAHFKAEYQRCRHVLLYGAKFEAALGSGGRGG
ncbi:hypothetical protein LTR53_012836, partial [Teratosphaeriaceae sp. CCFEE 6253]